MTETTTVTVALGARAHDIVIGPGVIGEAARHLAPVLRRPRVIVVTDEAVAKLYLPALEHSLRAASIEGPSVVVPAGERTKDFRHLERLLDELLAARVSRDTTLVALGGGVIGDLAGFAAAIVLRGIDLVQVPTTLLAQVDSSIGGKTGINTRHGKNLVGSFHQPQLVLTDTRALDSLPRRELLAGYAELVKYALIEDARFFDWLVEHAAAVLDGDASARRHAIATCCRAKARIVAADERESGARALLNLGHSFGHPLEAECGFSDALLHGEAVAIGTVMAFDMSVRLGLCPAADLARVRAHFEAVGLPTAPPAQHWRAGDLLAHMAHDKKARGGRAIPPLVLVRGIGRAFLHQGATAEQILPVLEDALAS
jgi:3-dehydroquinate synthase